MRLLQLVCVLIVIPSALCDSYIVRLKKPHTTSTLLKNLRGRIKDRVKEKFSFGSFEGFVGDFDSEWVKILKKNPLVRIKIKSSNTQISDVCPDVPVTAFDVKVQSGAPNHLSRISHTLPLHEIQEREFYYEEQHQGQNVNAYVLDSGVVVSHTEFEERASHGKDFTSTGLSDTSGHGTHVAGVIGSKTFGVAKKINIISVKCLDETGSGSLSSLLSAIEYSVKHRIESNLPGVANLSLGSLRNVVLNEAVRAAVEQGLVIVVAAGNSNSNACQTSPAGSKHAIAVGAIDDQSDHIAGFSNWGKCVDIFASGVQVESLSKKESETKKLSGTSMAAPAVSGLIGILLSRGVEPSNVVQHLYAMALKGAINMPRKHISNNCLAHYVP